MADSGFYTEKWLMNNINPEELRSDIMVQGQHATDHYGLPGFVDAVSPNVVILSSPYRPRSRNSRNRMKEYFRKQKITILEQAQTGAISICLDTDHAHIQPFLKHQSITLKRAD